MNFITPYIQTIRTILIIAGIALAIWFYKDWQFQKSENIRQTENNSQLRKADSLRFTSQILNAKELNDYLEYQNSDLKNNLAKDGIKTNRIKEIINTNFIYKDTTYREFKGKFIDSTKCLTIKGIVNPNGTVSITDRQFNNKMNAVAYWERRQWNFLGMKTRFLGKKQMTAKVFDGCGETKIVKIEKKE
jgi:hypothetical protein